MKIYASGHLFYRCHECGQWFPKVIELGEPPDHESSTVNLCTSCLKQALTLMEKNDGVQTD
jgi:DNA-directed RNA polymerase subunit RPC12/RpoP